MKDDVSIVLCGEAGQGIQTVEAILARALKLSGYNVFVAKEYMSRVRGGVNSTSIRVASERAEAYVDRIDVLVSLHPGRTRHLLSRISDKTVVLEENNNMVVAGLVCGLFQVEKHILTDHIKKHFTPKGEKTVKDNLEAAEKGYQSGGELLASGNIQIEVKKDPKIKDQVILSGAEAVGLGAIAGGCNFISAYPMTPATGVLTFLSRYAREFGIVAEQAEDEISAMNMSLGAWYAGARALVSTAGGGFALMVEGLSLAGMLEMPVVIHLGQRPAPATGLPTRTEQADLNFALNCGHGEFPRVIFAPGGIEDAFYLTQRAFNLADKCQLPVFVMTDQYLMDSYHNLSSLDVSGLQVEKQVVRTNAGYRRYALTGNGISPRGVPGFGEGLVVVDSDEHDEEGHITEDLDLRTAMVKKRLKKLELAQKEVLKPRLIGAADYRVLVMGWGSTYHAVKEALGKLKRNDVAFLHYRQVYPLYPGTLEYLKRAQKVIAIENNATSQFADLIKLRTGFDITERINKFNGLPFSVEEIADGLNGRLGD